MSITCRLHHRIARVMVPISERCRSCVVTLRKVASTLSKVDETHDQIKDNHINEQLDRFGLFVGNMGAMHTPDSPMSIESRLREANDVLLHINSLLLALQDVASELLQITSGERDGMQADISKADQDTNEDVSEVHELREEMEETITQLFRVSSLIRRASPTDTFAKALSRTRYLFNDQFDIAHVGEKYPKLQNDDYIWLRRRLGQAITQRRQYLCYIRDHREALDGMLDGYFDTEDSSADNPQAHMKEVSLALRPGTFDTISRPSYVTKATTVDPERVAAQLLVAHESDLEEDTRSYTTISRSIDEGHESSTTIRIPKLGDLHMSKKKEIECPFCFRVRKFRNERSWRRHVFSDLRSYVCTFPNCTVPYFEDINEWFQHEMRFHRVAFKCLICPNTVYHEAERYRSHLRIRHPEVLDSEDDEEQPANDLARVPLAQIPASDCPCCSDWGDRLRARADQSSRFTSEDIITVSPTIFKRHVAGHLEQLALFAVPIASDTHDDHNSNAAIEETNSQQHTRRASEMSALTFASCPDTTAGPDSSVKVVSAQNTPAVTQLELVPTQEPTTKIEAASTKDSVSSIHEVHSLSDGIPFPVFLRKTHKDLNSAWTTMETAQLERLRSSVLDEANIAGSDWRSCNAEEHASRNRYANVSPYLTNRMRLEVPEGYSDYINASSVVLRTTKSDKQLKYIATQGPTATTWSHFWRMIWKETPDSAVIIMLTQTHESGREKCFPYYPQSVSDPDLCVNEDDEFDDGLVHRLHLDSVTQDSEARTTVRNMELITGEASCRVWHAQFAGWPDFSTPEGADVAALVHLIELSRARNSNDCETPRVVHCSAGIGRTGTFLALDWLLLELDEGSFDELSDDEDPIVTVVERLRAQRAGMVQSKDQLFFLYNVIRERWRERWLALHPAEATRLGVISTQKDVEPAFKRHKSSSGMFDQDSLQSKSDARAALEAELMDADMVYEKGRT